MRPLPNASSPRGASMGRCDETNDTDAAVVFEMQRLRWVSFDYDEGGAYWGGGSGDYIFRAEGESDAGIEEMFVRAKTSDEARAVVLGRYPNASFDASVDLDTMVSAYVEAALWNTTNSRYMDDLGDGQDGETEESETLDESGYDLSAEAEAGMRADCAKFLDENGPLVARALRDGYTMENVGYDFWMTRAGTGVGFSDRNLGEVGDELHEIAGREGEVDLYVGDDDLVHKSGGCTVELEADASAAPSP